MDNRKNERVAHKAKFGRALRSTERYDNYEFSCVIEDCGDGIALIENASGSIPVVHKEDLLRKLEALGFEEVRWIRIVRKKLLKCWTF